MTALPNAPAGPTYEDILALPENVRGEILAGELFVSPRPAPPHAVVTSTLGAMLNMHFQLGVGGPGGWWIVDEPELSLDVDPKFDPVVPDIAGWKRETMPGQPETAQYHVTPDWICEVLSPGTMGRDRTLKLPFYGRAKVDHVWLVDPRAKSVEVFRLTDGGWLLAEVATGDVTVAVEPFGAVELPLALLWDLGER